MTITISRESKYAEGREFADLDAVIAEVARWAPDHDLTAATNPDVRQAVASLLDLPVKAVTVA